MTAEQRRGSTDQSSSEQPDRQQASAKSKEYRLARNLLDDGGTVAEREYEDHVHAEGEVHSDEPDVLLDAPVVKVDEINLEVEELRARVSLQAEVLQLLRLNVGADVFIGQVALEIKGVEAQALLKVRLENVTRILDRALTTIDRNPEILKPIAESVGSTVEDVGGGAGQAVGALGEGTGSAVEEVGAGASSVVEEVGEDAGSAIEEVGEEAGSAVGDGGEGVGEAVEDTGETATRTVQGAGGTVGQAARGPGRTAKQTKGRAQKAQEERDAKRRGRGSQGARRSRPQSSRRKPESDG
jgi:hypothetical protein